MNWPHAIFVATVAVGLGRLIGIALRAALIRYDQWRWQRKLNAAQRAGRTNGRR